VGCFVCTSGIFGVCTSGIFFRVGTFSLVVHDYCRSDIVSLSVSPGVDLTMISVKTHAFVAAIAVHLVLVCIF